MTPEHLPRPSARRARAPAAPEPARPIQASLYVAGMSDGTLARSYGKVFNEVAVEYDRNRPAYPDALVDQACEVARIGDGDRVLEIGCGTGQLTRSLLARGLRVTAIEPGDRLIRIAEENLRDAADVQLVHARLEDMRLPRESYEAVFSASAIHWVDPDLSWRKIADALAPNGTLALIQYFGLQEQRGVDDREALLSALRRHAPALAATWPTYRDLDGTIAGVQERRRNVADAWAWLGSCDIGRDYAADLFEDLQLAVVPTLIEHTAGELGALLGTMSFWARLSPAERDALVNENHALHERLGRPIRASTVAVLVTARRSPSRLNIQDSRPGKN
ncbi:MAG TPA: methyltransferase domain-containing protein [Solirubrobacteraceae bacterium]|jgi:SAM-dependent methyltransferase